MIFTLEDPDLTWEPPESIESEHSPIDLAEDPRVEGARRRRAKAGPGHELEL